MFCDQDFLSPEGRLQLALQETGDETLSTLEMGLDFGDRAWLHPWIHGSAGWAGCTEWPQLYMALAPLGVWPSLTSLT